jgi:hypothetical protein
MPPSVPGHSFKCPECDFRAFTTAGISSHLKGKHPDLKIDPITIRATPGTPTKAAPS